MMQADLIPGATRIVGESQVEYTGLPIRDVVIDCGPPLGQRRAMRSEWRPTPEEAARIAAGAPVQLTVLGTVHPPVMVEVGEQERA